MEILIPAWVDGNLTPVEKLAVHQRGLRHRAVSVFIVANDKILLQQRALEKYHTPGLWANACCTHPNWGEEPLNCAQRRLEQELGISGLELSNRGQLEYRADVGGGLIEHEVVDVFLAETNELVSIRANPSEVMGTCWLSISELRVAIAANPQAYTPWLKIYLDKHIGQILPSSLG